MTNIMKGSPVAAKLSEDLIKEAADLKSKGINPTLAIVRVGDKEDDKSYERGAMKRCEKIGVDVKQFHLDADISQDELVKTIQEINDDNAIHGALLLRPFPKHMDDKLLRNTLLAEKDIDGITDVSLAGVFTSAETGYPPCTARACIELLHHYGHEIAGKRAVVVGRSLVIGKPIALMLLAENATVSICHSKTPDLPGICRDADIIIAAVGRANMISENHLSESQVIVDVGINVDAEGKLIGDVDYDGALDIVEAITPVPGGVGAVTTSVLAKHVIQAAKKTIK